MTPLPAWPYLVLLFLAALAGGAQNAVAGGGSFLTFPSLIAAGLGSKMANATSTVALWPGSVASLLGYRADLPKDRRFLLVSAAVSLVGGIVGSLLLLWTPPLTFDRLIPFLLLAATLIFAFGPRLTRRLRESRPHPEDFTGRALTVFAAVQFGVGLYGGYFGGGIGILMLAAFAALGMVDLNRMNGLKAVLGGLINGTAVVIFAAAGLVDWPLALIMVAGAVIGGYGGARLSKQVRPNLLRCLIIVVGTTLALVFFVKVYA